jgi:mycothiol synthase
VGEQSTGLSEQKAGWLELPQGRHGAGLLVLYDENPVGYAGLSPAQSQGEWAVEVVTGDSGVAAQLVEEAMDRLSRRGVHRIRWWTYDPLTEVLPPRLGFRPERRLLRMARPLPGPDPSFPTEVEVRGFTPDEDEDAWLTVNNAAFAGHAENSNLDRQDLLGKMELEWFDPAGLRMAWWGTDLAGFCWTKRHGSADGEIYIIGTAPAYQGHGLGRALVLEGMRHLSGMGCSRVFLYTEGDNERAVGLYESLEFEVEVIHRSFIAELSPAATPKG